MVSVSAQAALVTIGRRHGLPLTLPSLRRLSGMGDQDLNGVQIVFAASRFGFRATPLEGEFEQLPEVILPAIVALSEQRYQVLFEVDADSAVTCDPATGKTRRISRQEFCSDWTGVVFQVLPEGELEPVREELRRLAIPWFRMAGAVGIAPFSASRLLFLAAALAWTYGAFTAPAVSTLIGICLLLSLWMAVYPAGCRRCGTTAALSGLLPLPWIGAVFYGAVLLAPRDWVWPALVTASGVHLALVAILAHHRIACYLCLGTAVMAWLAAGLAWNSNAGWEMLLLPAAFALTLSVVTLGRKLAAYGAQDAFLKLAQIVAAEETPEGRARLIIYGRKGCPLCAYFKLVVLPVMAEEYGDALEIEEREAGAANIPVPLFFVNGAVRIALTAVPTEEMHTRIGDAVQAALEPMDSPLGRLGGFHWVGLETNSK